MMNPSETHREPELTAAAAAANQPGAASVTAGPVPSPDRPRKRSSSELLDQMVTTENASIDAEAAAAMAEMTDGDLSHSAAISADAGAPTNDALLTGRIANIGSQDVLIDFGARHLGAMPLADFDKGEQYSIGDTIEVAVLGENQKLGLLNVSRRRARQLAILRDLKIGASLEAHVTGMNKGGLEVEVSGLRGFVPASQVDIHFMKDISALIGQTIHAEVTKFAADEGDLVLSRRNWLLKEGEERKKKMIGELEVGQVRRGVVRGLSEFGAFVDLGGVDALLHISDMSWGRVAKPEEVVKVGDEIEAKIIKLNREKGKISLSLKQTLANPWDNIEQKYSVGMKLKGRVARMQPFGAFVEIEAGVDGLVPVGEMSWTRRIHNPAELVKEGDIIDVAVIGVDSAKRRITLSLKQATPDPWSLVAEKYTPGSKITGKVARTTEFGAFVSLGDGIDGLIHISELSDQRIKAVTDKVKPGQEVEVRVLAVDTTNHKISLSMKPPPREPTPEELAAIERERAALQKKREKAASRRGGITIGWDQGLGNLDPSKFAR